jgi:sulfhydrogenase subunit beta (sulfur reductase)
VTGGPGAQPYVIERPALDALIVALQGRGYSVVGPTVRSRSIEYGELRSADDLPAGWTDEQDGGTYRLLPREDEAVFGHTGGHTSAKNYLFPPTLRVWRSGRDGDGALRPVERSEERPRYAFLGSKRAQPRKPAAPRHPRLPAGLGGELRQSASRAITEVRRRR